MTNLGRRKNKMMYPFMQLEDNTEIVHSATCYLPEYKWDEITGFTDDDIDKFQELLESTAHLIIRFAKDNKNRKEPFV